MSPYEVKSWSGQRFARNERNSSFRHSKMDSQRAKRMHTYLDEVIVGEVLSLLEVVDRRAVIHLVQIGDVVLRILVQQVENHVGSTSQR